MKYCSIAKTTKMASTLADLNVVARSEFKLKPEQQVAVKSLLDGKDVLAVLPAGYGKKMAKASESNVCSCQGF